VNGSVAERIDAIAAEFAELEPRERLELLLEFAEKLAPLPPRYEAERDAGMNRVQECQTPVFLWVDAEGGQTHIHAYVAPEAPTVKGFVSILADIFTGAKAEEVAATESSLVHRFGLAEALGIVRLRGMQAIAHHIRKKFLQAAGEHRD
jgi:cysteine desulfuration protein SufE